MNLTAPPEGVLYSSIEAVVRAVNEHAGPEGYAVIIARTKVSKKGVKRKVWLRCDRGGKIREPKGQKRVHGSSRLEDCPFKLTAKRIDEESEEWILTVEDASHNHAPTLAGSHPALRKIALDNAAMDAIRRQSRVDVPPAKILSSLRLDQNEENPLFKKQDIYNAKQEIRRKGLGALTPIQALMKQLRRDDWHFSYAKDERDQITQLFFSRVSSMKILKSNFEVLVMDCTYKTNRFKMPLLVITGQTGINTTFYVAFVFISHEDETSYKWALMALQDLYETLHLSNPTTIVTDCEAGLIPAMHAIYPEVKHLLCVWHININVLSKCRRKFHIIEAWQEFYSAWQAVVYASTEDEYNAAWNSMCATYLLSHPEQIQYLRETYLMRHKEKFVTYWTNQVLHFFNTVTSRTESAHAALKRNLNSSVGTSIYYESAM